jgi:hypothetical protein
MTLFGFFIPVVIIFTCYTFILIYVKKNLNFITKILVDESSNQTISTSNIKTKQKYFNIRHFSITVFQKKKSLKSFAIEWQITKNSIVIISAFCLAWLPYGLISMFAQFSENREQFVTPHTTILPVLFAKTSVVLNPIIYFLKNKNFRKHLKSIVTRT